LSESDPYAAPDTFYPTDDVQKAYEESQGTSEAPEPEAVPEEVIEEPEAGEPEVQEEVPTGSAAVVLKWVGDDAGRANRALEVELAGENRKTLIKNLQSVIN
jgi:hypothetical protein